MSDARVKFSLNNGTSVTEGGDPSVSYDEFTFQPPAALLAGAHVAGLPDYHKLYKESINNPDAFWRAVAQQLHFDKLSDKGLEWNFDVRKGPVFVRFLENSTTNLAYNCLDRHVHAGLGARVAFHWEGNHPSDSRTLTYAELLTEVRRFAAVLRMRGVTARQVVAIYMPMCLELCIAMLACARIGAIHSVVFGGFSAEALAARLIDGGCRVLVTADGAFRGDKLVALKTIADDAIRLAAEAKPESTIVNTLIVLEHLDKVTKPDGVKLPQTAWTPDRDVRWAEATAKVAAEKLDEKENDVTWFDSEHPLFILYTSGSTGKPKGVLHTTAGYMTYTYFTTRNVFDIRPAEDVYWCTADCGWITGHSYVLYGPLLTGATSVVFEGLPNYPHPDRYWQVVDKYRVTKLYTSPTAMRALAAADPKWLQTTTRETLKVVGTVGEPINPATWVWIKNKVCPRGGVDTAIVDTYWQTETGGHIVAPLPAATPTKPGSATLPLPGQEVVLVDDNGRLLEGPGAGRLCLARAWPSCARTVWGDHARFEQTYFAPTPGLYMTGDGARRDADGYLWVTGRIDDLINVSGHLLSTAEIESALTAHAQIAEAAVVAAPHDIKGSTPYAFVTPIEGVRLTDQLRGELVKLVRQKIGAIAVPDAIQEAPGLPKTRSGKVTRRILRKIAEGCDSGFGDTTTLVDENVIVKLLAGRPRTGG